MLITPVTNLQLWRCEWNVLWVQKQKSWLHYYVFVQVQASGWWHYQENARFTERGETSIQCGNKYGWLTLLNYIHMHMFFHQLKMPVLHHCWCLVNVWTFLDQLHVKNKYDIIACRCLWCCCELLWDESKRIGEWLFHGSCERSSIESKSLSHGKPQIVFENPS